MEQTGAHHLLEMKADGGGPGVEAGGFSIADCRLPRESKRSCDATFSIVNQSATAWQ
jgi:hypothetical protein